MPPKAFILFGGIAFFTVRLRDAFGIRSRFALSLNHNAKVRQTTAILSLYVCYKSM